MVIQFKQSHYQGAWGWTNRGGADKLMDGGGGGGGGR